MIRLERTFRPATRVVIAATLACVAATTGCGMFHTADELDSEPARYATTQQSYNASAQVPQSLQPGHRPVVQDQLPLIYLVESNGVIRVTNVESGEEIATFPVKESQIVRVEAKGVLLANKKVIGAQLAPGMYAIEMIPAGEVSAGMLQSSQTVTRSVPAATTRPATQPAPPAAPQ